MASKAAKRAKRASHKELLEHAKRHLEKGHPKLALKDAKASHRLRATAESRSFLEHVLIARAQELYCYDRPACRAVLEELLKLGVTEPAVEAALPELLASFGLLDRLPGAEWISSDERARLENRIADEAVLHAGESCVAGAELRAAAERIRSALASLEQGDEASALERLQGIGRESPLADWRFFVRGLAAYYRRDDEQMQDNWERLDPNRAAARIANSLLLFCGLRQQDSDDDQYSTALGLLEDGLAAAGTLSQLTALSECLKGRSLADLVTLLRSLRRGLGRSHPDLWRRVSDCVAEKIIWTGRSGLFERMIRLLSPPELDPYWNRARALLRDRGRNHDVDDSMPYWLRYVEDLESVPALSADERRIAQGLVWLRVADIGRQVIAQLKNCNCGRGHEEEIENVLETVEHSFESCLERLPRHAAAYWEYASLYDELDRPVKAFEVKRRAMERLPDDSDMAIRVARDFLEEGRGLEALEVAQRARKLLPLSSEVTELVWKAHISSANELALRGDVDEARRHFDAADQVLPRRREHLEILAARAVLARKLGRHEESNQWIDRALQQSQDPAPVWMMLTTEAQRYRLPLWDAHPFEENWFRALRGPRRSETAGTMSRYMVEQLVTRGDDGPADEYVERMLRYLRRAGRVAWQHEDLRSVCRLLHELEEWKLLKRFVRVGCQTFTSEAVYFGLAADGQVRDGILWGRWARALKHAKQALELARAAGDTDDWETVESATKRVRSIEARLMMRLGILTRRRWTMDPDGAAEDEQ